MSTHFGRYLTLLRGLAVTKRLNCLASSPQVMLQGQSLEILTNGSSTWHSFHRCTHFTFWSIFIRSYSFQICSSIYSTFSPVSVVVSFTGLWVSLRTGKPRPCEHYFCSLQLGFTLVRLSQSPLTSPHITSHLSHLWYATWLSGWLLGLAGLAARSPVFGALHL